MPQLRGQHDDHVQSRSLSSSQPAPPPVDKAKAASDNLSAAQRLKLEMMGGGTTETPSAPVDIPGLSSASEGTNGVAASAPPRLVGTGSNGEAVEARGTKRTAGEAELPATRTEAEQAEVTAETNADEAADMNNFAPVAGQTPAPLKMVGNVGEQEDLVKCVAALLLAGNGLIRA